MIKVNDEMGLYWLVPTHGKYRHRRFRGIAIQGWYYTYTTCMGIEHAEDQFAEKEKQRSRMQCALEAY